MKIFIFVIILFAACSTPKASTPCVENIKFKTEFFRNIKVIDNYFTDVSGVKTFKEYEVIRTAENVEEFRKSLLYISKYAHVSFESMDNYARLYPLEIFEQDKKGWLKWYEANKCNNIQPE
ncbi:MAG: hypothetical protein EOO45_16700 [Flavobacterium sp.]|nr:MAG: hypothetical protein EOO45_16700 [Flavobacterium sp.]